MCCIYVTQWDESHPSGLNSVNRSLFVLETHSVFLGWDRKWRFKQCLHKCQASKGQCRQWLVLPDMWFTKFIASMSINLWSEISDITVTKVLYRFKSSWGCVSLWRALQRGTWLTDRRRHPPKFRFICWIKSCFIRTSRLSCTPHVYSGYPKLKLKKRRPSADMLIMVFFSPTRRVLGL